MRSRRLYLLFTIVTLLLVGCAQRRIAEVGLPKRVVRAIPGKQPLVRVLVNSEFGRVTITPGNYVIRGDSGEVVSDGSSTVTVEEREGLLVCLGRSYRSLEIDSEIGVVIGGDRFPGRVWMIPHDGKIGIVNELPLEEYVRLVMTQEVPSSFHMEALKAMSVAVRTYTLYQIEKNGDAPFHLTSVISHQVYRGVKRIEDRVEEAVRETRGEVLMFEGDYALTVYHSTCGGRTESSRNVWGKGLPYLESVKCGYCQSSPRFRWSYVVRGSEFVSLLKKKGIRDGSLRGVRVISRFPSGRVERLRVSTDVGSVVLKGKELRRLVGYDKIRSLLFDVEFDGSLVKFTGSGYGHGVGLCQYGADGMARSGAGYRDILRHYYSGRLELVKIYR